VKKPVVVELTPVNLTLAELPDMLRATANDIADDIEQGAPWSVLLLRADDLNDLGVTLQSLALAHAAKERLETH
jgi:hypothetical protein